MTFLAMMESIVAHAMVRDESGLRVPFCSGRLLGDGTPETHKHKSVAGGQGLFYRTSLTPVHTSTFKVFRGTLLSTLGTT